MAKEAVEKLILAKSIRFAQARKHCSVIAKRGDNDFQHYKYVMESDIVSLVNEACAENELYWTCSYYDFQTSLFVSDKQKTSIRTSCRCVLQVFCAITGELVIQSESFGDSLDTSDKSIYKTQTGAKKYALMSTFGIATYDDPEKDSPLMNDTVRAKLTGEKLMYKYFIPDSAMDENAELSSFVMKFKQYMTFNETNDVTIAVDKEILKLSKFLIKG